MSSADLSVQLSWLAEVRIRQVSQADLPALEWEGEFTHFRRVYAKAFERASRGQALLWVAEAAAGKLLGQLFVLLNSDIDLDMADGHQRAFIHSFRVRPEFRRGGLGSRLIRWAETDLGQRGFHWVSLHVARKNQPAIRFYERWGYQRIAPVTGEWTYEDHEGLLRRVVEPSWRMDKHLA
jgi:ribosomal protein S18 acetylase RimI-like enzyme